MEGRDYKILYEQNANIRFGYTSKDFSRNVGFSTKCIMQPQKANI